MIQSGIHFLDRRCDGHPQWQRVRAIHADAEYVGTDSFVWYVSNENGTSSNATWHDQRDPAAGTNGK